MEVAHTDDNLASLLSERYEVPITVNDIKKCNQDMVQKIYIHFLREIASSLDQIHTMPLEVTESVEQYPDMYLTATCTMSLARVIEFYLSIIFGEESFNASDICDPKPKRTRQFFWMLLDFLSQPKEEMNDIEDQMSLKLEKYQEKLDNIRKLQEKLQQRKLMKAEHKIEEEEEEKRIAEDNAVLQECQDRKNKLKNEVEKRKLASASLNTGIKEAEMEVIQGNERVKELCSQVVEDGERVEFQERENQLAQLKCSMQKKKEDLAVVQQDMAKCEAYRDAVNTVLATLRDIQQEYNKEKDSVAPWNQVSQEQSAVQEEREDKAMQIELLHQQYDSEHTRASQIRDTWSMKKESVFEEIKQNKQTLEDLRRDRTEYEIVYQDKENEHLHITSETAKVCEQASNMESYIISYYKKILHVMEEKNQNLQSSLTEVHQSLEHYKVD